MALYTIRPGFSIFQLGNVFLGGEEIDLSPQEFELHKHKLEGVDSDPLPEQPGDNGNNNNNSSGYPAPYLAAVLPPRILVDRSTTIELEGSFFKPDMQVSATGLSVNAVNFISDNLLQLEVTASSNLGFFDLELNNGTAAQFAGVVEISEPIILDLRGASAVVVEKSANTNLSYTDSWLEVSSTENSWRAYLRFVGQNDEYVWDRSLKKNLSLLFFPSTSMIGIGSRSTNPSSSAQYTQAEILGYFNGFTNFWGLYGNNGNLGSTATQYLNQNIPNSGNPFKLTLTSNGEPGGTYSVYELVIDDTDWQASGLTRPEFVAQNLTLEDWFETDDLVATGEISSTMSADEAEIMPFLTLLSNQNVKIIGFYIE